MAFPFLRRSSMTSGGGSGSSNISCPLAHSTLLIASRPLLTTQSGSGSLPACLSSLLHFCFLARPSWSFLVLGGILNLGLSNTSPVILWSVGGVLAVAAFFLFDGRFSQDPPRSLLVEATGSNRSLTKACRTGRRSQAVNWAHDILCLQKRRALRNFHGRFLMDAFRQQQEES